MLTALQKLYLNMKQALLKSVVGRLLIRIRMNPDVLKCWMFSLKG